MRLLLVAYSDSKVVKETIIGLSSAARDRGHDVTVFFDGGSVGLVRSGRANRDIERLTPEGVRLLVCRTSAATSGLESLRDLVRGAGMSSLAELVELTEESDRTIFLG
jgi:predicted peroxiredoxin